MTDVAAPAAPAAAPSAPAQQAPQTSRGRVSDFERGMEAKNRAAQQRHDAPPPPAPVRQQLRPQSPERQQRDAAVQQQQRPTETAPEETQEQQLLGAPEEPAELEQPAEEPQLAEETEQPAQPADQQALADALREYQETGVLPDALMAAKVEWTDANGLAREETVEELKQGAMRLSEFHRNMNGLRVQQQQMAERDQNVRAHFEKIRDPQVFLDEYKERGYADVIKQAVDIEIAARKQRKQLIEAAGYRVMQQLQCAGNDARVIDAMRQADAQLNEAEAAKLENRRIKRENEMLARQAQAQQANQMAQANVATLQKSLEQLMPTALKALGLFDSEVNRSKVLEHLGMYVKTLPNWDGTYRREHMLAAARIRREELEFEAAAKRGQPVKKPKQKPVSRALPPSASTGASRSGTAQPAVGGRKRPSEMATDPKFGGLF